MNLARVKFAVFAAIVLGLPAGLVSLGVSHGLDLAKLALILSPAIVGFALNGRLGPRGERARLGQVGFAAAVTLAVAVGALAVALAASAVDFSGPRLAPAATSAALATTTVTSVLEELGWAGGGLALATAAMGPRFGVAVLGVVWAAWHVIPSWAHIGLFPQLETGPPAMIAMFVVSAVIYRELLTLMRERAQTWWAAAAGHAAPNIALTAAVCIGLSGLQRPSPWLLFPAPGGVVFALLALAAVLVIRRKAPRL